MSDILERRLLTFSFDGSKSRSFETSVKREAAVNAYVGYATAYHIINATLCVCSVEGAFYINRVGFALLNLTDVGNARASNRGSE